FAAHSHAAGLAPRSIQRRLSAVRSFYEFLLREGRNGGADASSAPAAGRRRRSERLTRNPAHDVSAPRAARRLPQTLDADQMARLLQIPAGDGLSTRSEERRVGKEWRSGWPLCDEQKKDVCMSDVV